MKPLLILCLLAPLAVAQDAASTFRDRVQPLLKTYCTECHAGAKPKAGIQLSGPRTADQFDTERDHWFRVLDALEAGTMPPKEEPQPKPAERAALVAWLRGDFTATLLAKQRAEGRSKLRRLSRTEYSNTILDLFGVKPTVGLNLPTDGRVDGYDKVAAALPLSASGAAGYFKMADDILARMLRPIPKTPPKAVAKPRAPDLLDDLLGEKKSDTTKTAPASPFDPARTVRAIAFGSEQFYEKEGLAPLKSARTSSDFMSEIPGYEGKVCAWIDVPLSRGPESKPVTSWKRDIEVSRIADEVERLLKVCDPTVSIGVITFYSAQREAIFKALSGKKGITEWDAENGGWRVSPEVQRGGVERLRIGSVDAFQGKEFDIVLLSVVRSNDQRLPQPGNEAFETAANRKYGHLRLSNRMNVAMSRQRSLLVAVGDAAMARGTEAEIAVPALVAFLNLCGGQHGLVR